MFEKDGRKRAALEVACTTCHTRFLKRKDWVADTNYCNSKCRGVAQFTKIDVTCTICNAIFKKKPSAIKASKSGLLFCSRICKDIAQQVSSGIALTRPTHYRDGLSDYRSVAFKAFPHHCHHCNYNEYVELLQVHHIDSDRENNGLDNLVILCPTHHWAITIRKATMGPDRIWHWVG